MKKEEKSSEKLAKKKGDMESKVEKLKSQISSTKLQLNLKF